MSSLSVSYPHKYTNAPTPSNTRSLAAPMFFTRIGKVVAHLIFWASAFRVVMAFGIAFTAQGPEDRLAMARRYLGNVADTGEAIDRGLKFLLVGLALGILCEISARLYAKGKDASDKATE